MLNASRNCKKERKKKGHRFLWCMLTDCLQCVTYWQVLIKNRNFCSFCSVIYGDRSLELAKIC